MSRRVDPLAAAKRTDHRSVPPAERALRSASRYSVAEVIKLVSTDLQALEDPSFNKTMDDVVQATLDKSQAQMNRQTVRRILAGIAASTDGERQEEDEKAHVFQVPTQSGSSGSSSGATHL